MVTPVVCRFSLSSSREKCTDGVAAAEIKVLKA